MATFHTSWQYFAHLGQICDTSKNSIFMHITLGYIQYLVISADIVPPSPGIGQFIVRATSNMFQCQMWPKSCEACIPYNMHELCC